MTIVASTTHTATASCITHTSTNRELQLIKPSHYSLSHFKPSRNNYIATTFLSFTNDTKFLVRSSTSDESNSNDVASTTTTTMEEEKWEESESSPAEVTKGPPSLISALNVQKALRGIAITDVDHYGRLGLRIGCTYDQVRVAYKDKIKELMSQGLEEEELNQKQELLRESYAILSSEEERRLYDWSLARNDKPERYVWPFEVDITQTPKGTPPPGEPEDVGPTILVGYFFLGWLVLGVALSIALNL